MSNVTRYNPFEDFFSDLGKGFFLKPLPLAGEMDVKMKIDVAEDDKSYTVRAEIPGVRKDDIQIDVSDDQVSLRADVKREKEEKQGEKVVYSERAYGMASRTLSLPVPVDAKTAKAQYKDGVLSLVLPKKANGSAKRVEVS